MSADNATVSVVIPCYNGASFLRETLESVLNQTHPPLEVIVVDDGSTDDSATIAESFGSPVRVLHQENQGESVARNYGMDEAQGEWIALLDADDLWKPHKLEMQLAVADEETVAVHSNLYFFGDRNGETRIQRIPESRRYSVTSLATSNHFVGPGSTLLVRSSIAPRFPTWTKHAEDLIFLLELVQKGRIKLVEEALTGYRRHENSQSSEKLAFLRWFETIDQWLCLDNSLAPHQVQAVRSAWIENLCKRTRAFKWKCRREEYSEMCEYLEKFRGDSRVDAVLCAKTYPQWFYRLVGVLPRLSHLRPLASKIRRRISRR